MIVRVIHRWFGRLRKYTRKRCSAVSEPGQPLQFATCLFEVKKPCCISHQGLTKQCVGVLNNYQFPIAAIVHVESEDKCHVYHNANLYSHSLSSKPPLKVRSRDVNECDFRLKRLPMLPNGVTDDRLSVRLSWARYTNRDNPEKFDDYNECETIAIRSNLE